MRVFRVVFLLFLVAAARPACAVSVRDPMEKAYVGEALQIQERILAHIGKNELDSAFRYARRILAYGESRNDDRLRIVGYAHTGQTWLYRDQYDSAEYYMQKGYDLWQKCLVSGMRFEQYKPVYMILNSLAILSANVYMNYEQATEYLIQGLNLARENGRDRNYSVMGHNLAIVFFIRQNPSGMKYVEEIYRDGLDRQDRFMIYVGAQGSAMMYLLQRDYEAAADLLRIADLNLDGPVPMTLLNLHAIVENGLGRPDAAENYFRQALALEAESPVTDVAYLLLTYGQFLREHRRYAEALSVLEKGSSLSQEKNNHIFSYQIYRELSDICLETGNVSRSLEYYKKYHQESDSVFNIRRERAINDLTLKYEEARYEARIREHELMLVKKNKNLQVIVFILFVALSVSGILYVMYRHKNRLYLRIAKQYRDASEKEQELRQEILRLKERPFRTDSGTGPDPETGPGGGEPAPADSGVQAADRNAALFSRLEDLMQRQQVWREPNLTRERVAELMGTNRTYLSNVVSERTGKSFVQYVNDYRIGEAIRVLSEAGTDIQMKALTLDVGFSSASTFYKFFREKVGMTPAKYKEKIEEIARSEKPV